MPLFRTVYVEPLKKEPGGMTKIYKPVCKVNGKAVHANDNKEESPFLILQDIDDPIKQSNGEK